MTDAKQQAPEERIDALQKDLATVTRERDEARDELRSWRTSCQERNAEVDSLTRELAEANALDAQWRELKALTIRGLCDRAEGHNSPAPIDGDFAPVASKIGSLRFDSLRAGMLVKELAEAREELAKASLQLKDVRTILDDFDEPHPSGDEVGIRQVASKAATEVLRLRTDKSALLAKVAAQQTELSEALAAVEELDTAGAELLLWRKHEDRMRGRLEQGGVLLAGEHHLLAALDALRAKTSGAAATAESAVASWIPNGGTATGPELPYETAPRLTKGVRYRVVEAVDDSTGPTLLAEGNVFRSRGAERLSKLHPGYYVMGELGVQGRYRVVRVEPEKAQNGLDGIVEKLAAEGTPVTRGVTHDAGGERSGPDQSEELAAIGDELDVVAEMRMGQPAWDIRGKEPKLVEMPDDGPPRVGDVVRHRSQPIGEMAVESVDTSGRRAKTQHGSFYWSDLIILRRAGQPEAKAVEPRHGMFARSKFAAQPGQPEMVQRDVDGIKEPLQGGPGPNTETVAPEHALLPAYQIADLVRKVVSHEREIMLLQVEMREIRAERAGRKDR